MDIFVYNVELEMVRCVNVLPRDNWSGQGLLGADISFGYLNKLPLRKRDMQNIKKAEKMKSIFGGISSSSPASASGKREPTAEGLSSDDDEEFTTEGIGNIKGSSGANTTGTVAN